MGYEWAKILFDPYDFSFESDDRDYIFNKAQYFNNIKLYEKAAKLRHLRSIRKMVELEKDQLKKWQWIDWSGDSLLYYYGIYQKYIVDKNIMYIAGKILKKEQPFLYYLNGKPKDSEERINVEYLINLYLTQNLKVRKSVDTWSIIATRLRIVKDVRIYIGKMIWEMRGDMDTVPVRKRKRIKI